jgi:hypothetical protein
MVKAKLKDHAGACEDLKKAQELNPTEAENYESFFADTAEYEEFYAVCFPGVWGVIFKYSFFNLFPLCLNCSEFPNS